MHDQRGSL